MITKDSLNGVDAEWFAMDSMGNIGIFATAGLGFIPKNVFDYISYYQSISASLFTPHWGSENIWQDYADMGFYVYDWIQKDRYYRKLYNPTAKMDIILQNKIINIPNIVKFEINFHLFKDIIY